MRNVCWTFILSLFLCPLGFASSVLVYQPQDETEPAPTLQTSVRPGQKLTLAAGVFDRDSTGKGWVQQQNHLNPQEFGWQASCMSNSSACPTVSMGTGPSVVTVDIPICMQIGSVVFNVTFPGLPAATVTLLNTEEPSICPDNGSNSVEPYQANPYAPEMRAQAVRAGSGGQGGGGGGYGSGGSGGRSADGRSRNGDPYSGSSFFGGGGSFGGAGNIVDPYRPPAIVMECSRGSGNQLVCQDVDKIRRQPHLQIRAQKTAKAKVAQPKLQLKPKPKNAVRPKRKIFPRLVSR